MARIIYVLTNPAIPDLVKIGVTSRNEVIKRIAELSRQTGVPLPFQCHYAGEVSNHPDNVEQLIFKTFAKNRVSRRKEFFAIEPDQAVSALSLANARDVTPQFQKKLDTQDGKGIRLIERTRRTNTVLKDLGIRPGTNLTLTRGHNIHCTVVDGNKVRFAGKVQSLSAAAVEALRKLDYKTFSAAGTHYWSLNGKSIGQIRREQDRKRNGI